jgi:hypothetical protein
MTTDVWKLETPAQDMAEDDLSFIATLALDKHSTWARNYLKHIWDDCSWQTIKERLYSEGSTWYVWYMDGVNHHLCHLMEIEHPGFHTN